MSHREKGIYEDQESVTIHWMKAQPAVSAFIRSMIHDRHEADDVLQEVALAVVKNYDQYDPSRTFTPWAIGIARIRVLRHFSKVSDQRLIFSDEIVDKFAGVFQNYDDEIDERSKALEVCLKKLNDRSRTVIELRHFRDMTVTEISEQLGVTPHAISNVLYRVRLALAKCVKRSLSQTSGK